LAKILAGDWLFAGDGYFALDAHPSPVASLVGVGVEGFGSLAVLLGRVADPAVQQGDITEDAHRDAQEGQAGERARLGDEVEALLPVAEDQVGRWP